MSTENNFHLMVGLFVCSIDLTANLGVWESLTIKLLGKAKYRSRPEKWQSVLARFIQECVPSDFVTDMAFVSNCHQANPPQKVEKESIILHTDYYSLDLAHRVKIFNCLLLSQFDRNQVFKEKINLRPSSQLRIDPLGIDVWGRAYWLLKDREVNILVYRCDPNLYSLELLCECLDGLRKLVDELKTACATESSLSQLLESRKPFPPASPVLRSSLDNYGIFGPLLYSAVSWEDEENCVAVEDKIQKSIFQTVKFEVASAESDQLPSPCKESVPVDHDTVDVRKAVTMDDPIVDQDPGCIEVSPENSATLDPAINAEDRSMDQLSSAVNVPNTLPCPLQGDASRETSETTQNPKKPFDEDQKDIESGKAIVATDVRRSGRHRKPVELFKMEPIQPKRSAIKKSRQNDMAVISNPTCTDKPKSRKRKSHKPTAESGAKRKRKSGSLPHLDVAQNGKLTKIAHKNKKRGNSRKSKNCWANDTPSSSSEDIYFNQALLYADNESSSSLSDGDVGSKKLQCGDLLVESDFDGNGNDEDSVDSVKIGRNRARQKRMKSEKQQQHDATPCQICREHHSPEWMLLCDQCDLGHHAGCLKPKLFLIPDGDWFCPRCLHARLITTLEECITAVDNEQKEELLRKRQERLKYVNISMTNIIRDDDEYLSECRNGKHKTGRSSRRRDAGVDYRACYLRSSDSFESEDDSSYDDSSLDSRIHQVRKPRGRPQCGSSSDQVKMNRNTAQARSHKTRHRRRYWIGRSSSSDDDDPQSPLAVRAARRKSAAYDINAAFKNLDEALEVDEKYQEEKIRRKTKHADNQEPIKIKDESTSNCFPLREGALKCEPIDSDSDVFKLSHSSRRSNKKPAVMTSSSCDSDSDNSYRKRRRGKVDDDFKPPSGSDEQDLSYESDANQPSDDDSDTSWLCKSRKNHKKINGGHGAKMWNPRRVKRRYPVFEGSCSASGEEYDGATQNSSLRPRRCAAAVVSYRESADEDDDLPCPRTHRRRLFSSDDESASQESRPKMQSQRIDSDQKSYESGDDEYLSEDSPVKVGELDSTVPSHRISPNFENAPEPVESTPNANTNYDDDADDEFTTKLTIDESSPSPVKVEPITSSHEFTSILNRSSVD